MPATAPMEQPAIRSGSVAEVFVAFLKLGLLSFGGPIAHLGYFHRELIQRRRWMDESHYAQLVALCQFLPGPASSQIGFALGLTRAGWLGAMAAFVAFTLPSALLLFAFAQLLPALEHPVGQAAIHGLKLVAVAVVAHGLWGMVQKLTSDASRRIIAAVVAAIVVVSSNAAIQLLVVVIGGVLGLVFCRNAPLPQGSNFELRYTRRAGGLLLVAFAVLLCLALVIPFSTETPLTSVAAAFYRAGALVFGGGHVVLPLLQEAVVEPGWLTTDEFLAGYGAAQAIPGPLFSVSAFLGARLDGAQGGLIGASVSLIAIFLPGFLLVAGTLPFWQALAQRREAGSALAGVNAAVVGLLAAALYDPVWTSAVLATSDFAIALVGFVLLAATRTPVLLVLLWCVVASVLSALFG